MANGVYGELKSTLPPLTSPAWPAMFTGKNPGKLGMFGFISHLVSQEKMFRLNSSLDYSSQSIWKKLNSHGKKVGLLNLPMTYPPTKIDSFMVCGIGSPDATKTHYTYPHDLKKKLDKVVGDYQIHPLFTGNAPGKEDQLIKSLDEILIKREKAASYLMANFPWDLFVCVFYVLDAVQHHFWHHMDKSHSKYNNNKYQDTIRDFYVKVDSAIGRLMEQMTEQMNILVVSDHGFGPSNGTFSVNRWLGNNKLLKFKDNIKQEEVNTRMFRIRNEEFLRR